MKKNKTQLQRIREIVARELDAGRPFPKRKDLAAELGKPPDHDFGGRVTFELQKIRIERGIATPQDVAAYRSKLGTYEPVSLADQQVMIVEELREEHELRWGSARRTA